MPSRWKSSFHIFLMFVTVGATALPAQTPLAPPVALDRAARSRLLGEIGKLLEDNYVFPDSGRHLAELLQRKSATDAYAGVTDPGAFADTVTKDLLAAAHDLHMHLLSPARARAFFITTTGMTDRDARAKAERARNYYFEQYQVLPANVAYLKLKQFAVADTDGRATAEAAMRMLANADAIILDLRDNPGGAEGLNQLLSSYFFTDSTRVLYSRYSRRTDSVTATRVLGTVSGPRLPTTPLFVLINGHSGSAAENMAYALQGPHRATLVGEPTAGAANSSTIMALSGGFAMQVPVSRVISPVTGTNWEGAGVQPDVHASNDSAAAVAYQLALQRLLAANSDSATRARVADALRSGLPPSLAPPATTGVPAAIAALNAYRGHFGDRTVTVQDGKLILQRPNAQPNELVMTARDTFGIRDIPEAQIVFGRDTSGAVREIRVRNLQGQWETAKRDGP